ncbi:hypothetical protein [Salisediminibacterium halotolerans]|uniref:hypothetical protein n=1 Tax=Salisediminibacterium halotolerans TaxID=517425 RepID=UPI00115FC51F|nr:hypothetical protein [Salisediminibacterium haloalkalitolerans]
MTSLDVMLKGTDDNASSVSLSRRRKPGCWVILFFEVSVLIKKKPCIHSSDASGKARDEDPDSAVSGRRILAESLPGASGG